MAECYCDYSDAPSVYRKAMRTARKPHRCYECGRQIATGEKYENVFAVWAGDPATCCTCQHCLDLREFVLAHVPCSCWEHGNMREAILDNAREYAHEAPGLLFGAYRREVRIVNARKSSN